MKASTWLQILVGGAALAVSTVTFAQNAETTDSAGVYAGPDSSYPEVGQLDPGTPIQVMGCLNDWSWCDVAFQDNRGWVYSPDISYGYQGGYVPLYSYAPALGISVVSFSVDSYWGSYYRGRPWYGQRDQWVHKTINHRRPPGPAPVNRLPPREVVRAEPARGGSNVGSPLHLSRADHPESKPLPDNRPADHAPAAQHAPPQHAPAVEHAPAERATAAERVPSAGHAAAADHPAAGRAEPEHHAAPAKPESQSSHEEHPEPHQQ
jgi:uncharacterized protein YraI